MMLERLLVTAVSLGFMVVFGVIWEHYIDNMDNETENGITKHEEETIGSSDKRVAADDERS